MTQMERCLKRHEHEDNDDNRDPKRVRITHKQADKRADLELTGDAASKRAKLCDTPSSSSPSSHEIAPKCMLHLVELRIQRCVKASRRSHGDAHKRKAGGRSSTGQSEEDVAIACWKKFHLSLRQSPKPQNSTASETSESTLRCTSTKPMPRSPVASGCCSHTRYDTC